MSRFKNIPFGYEHYSISKSGIVKSKEGVLKTETIKGYVYVNLYKDGKKRKIQVHRLVMLTYKGASHLPIHHMDSNRQNNNLKNLVYCTTRQNSHWRHEKNKYFSKYRGVSFNGKKYRAKIFINKKQVHLGYFDTELQAHSAYQKALVNV